MGVSNRTNKIVLGTVQFGINYGINNSSGQVPLDEVCTILKKSEQAGVKTLDTSSAYGISEQVLGKALKDSGTKFNIISKYPMCDKSVRNTFRQSLENLSVDCLYGYMVHHFEFYQENPEIFDEMTALKEEGKILKVGFSLYTIDELEYLLEKNVKFDILQFPYNIFDRQFEPYMQKLVENDVEIHTRSAFLQGLFFKDTNTLPDMLKPLRSYLDKVHQYCNDKGVGVEQLTFGYVLANENVKGALIGVDNHVQLEANLIVASCKLSQDDFDFIKSIDIKEKELLNPSNWS